MAFLVQFFTGKGGWCGHACMVVCSVLFLFLWILISKHAWLMATYHELPSPGFCASPHVCLSVPDIQVGGPSRNCPKKKITKNAIFLPLKLQKISLQTEILLMEYYEWCLEKKYISDVLAANVNLEKRKNYGWCPMPILSIIGMHIFKDCALIRFIWASILDFRTIGLTCKLGLEVCSSMTCNVWSDLGMKKSHQSYAGFYTSK